ncbi:uncharacterized protein BDW70DRAFT_165305 [Aspergillus foveolatus]|uniref:uncharacterized protein n=1 Tax=Aspergillus foveolatus TaxID=210207 RepID=UPI003CCCE06D
MTDQFEAYWYHAIADTYTSDEFYFDIAKEVCPSGTSRVAVQQECMHTEQAPQSLPRSLLWKRCCLESYAAWIQNPHGANKDGLRQTFYPMTMLQDSGSLRLETHVVSWSRQAGLLYSQFYSSTKEIFAAGNIYPFTNSAIESLALDPKLRKTWQLVGKGLSHDPVSLIRAYLYTKQRCHHALQGSSQKSFGTREEHRVCKALFDQIDTEFQHRQLTWTNLHPIQDDNPPYYCYPTPTLVDWLRWNINKFCVGFEMVYSLKDHHFITWESTRMMLMFLRCLQFSYLTGLIQRVGGCWHDVKYQANAKQPDGL